MKMVPHSIRGPSCESMNVVFAIRHSRQCKIRYQVEGHFLLINQSNDFSLSLSQWEIALGNPVTSQSPQAPLMTHHIHINFQRVPKDGLAQLHKKEKKEKKEKKKTLFLPLLLKFYTWSYTYFENLTTKLHILYVLNINVKFLSNWMSITI